MGAGASSDATVAVIHHNTRRGSRSAAHPTYHSSSDAARRGSNSSTPRPRSTCRLDPLDKTLKGGWELLGASESLTGKWERYAPDVDARIEAAFKDGQPDCQVVVSGRLFVISFASLEQRGHGGARKVRRVVIAEDGAVLTPEAARHQALGDPFAFQEDDACALFASPSVSSLAKKKGGDSGGGGGGGGGGASPIPATRDEASCVDGYDCVSGRQRAVLQSTIVAHTQAVYGVNFSVEGDRIITGSKDGTCKYWEASTSFLLGNFARHPGSVLSAMLSKSRPLAATGCDDDVVRIFDLSPASLSSGEGEKGIEPVELAGHSHKVYTVNFLDGNTLLSGSMDSDVRLWDLHKAVCTRVISAHESSIFFSCVAPRSKHFALTASDDCTMAAHDFRQADSVVARFLGHRRTLWGCDIRFDEGQYVSCGMDSRILLWDPRMPAAPIGDFSAHRTPIHSVEFLPDGTGVLSAARDCTFKIIECHGGATVLSIAAHNGNVFRASYNAATSTVMTCGADAMVKLWSITL